MPTTQDDIRNWLKRAPKDATHMLVVCDTFDWSDYPVFVKAGENARAAANANNGPNMTKLMEVYNLSMDLEQQLKAPRSFNYLPALSEPEKDILECFCTFGWRNRDWFAVELRPAFDRLVATGRVEPCGQYQISEAGRKALTG